MTEQIPKGNDDGTSKEVVAADDRVLSADEMNEWAKAKGYTHVTRGTYKNESSFLYIKSCLTVTTQDDARIGLSAARHLTKAGLVHPATIWGVFRPKTDREDGYQIFVVSPAIEAWSVERIGTEDENRFGIQSARDAPHIVEWVQRVEPEYQPGQPVSPNSLVNILNLTEASHPDNWGWDRTTGINYPVDIEVLDLSGHLDIAREWGRTVA